MTGKGISNAEFLNSLEFCAGMGWHGNRASHSSHLSRFPSCAWLSLSSLTCKPLGTTACRSYSLCPHALQTAALRPPFCPRHPTLTVRSALGRWIWVRSAGPGGRIRHSHPCRGFWWPNHLEHGLEGRWPWSRGGWPHLPGSGASSSSGVRFS